MLARVAVDIPLPHLDRLFDYAIDELVADQALPGTRVRVRFAGRQRDGYIIELTETTEVAGRLATLSKVVSSEPVLSPAQIRLIRQVADHYAGSFADVVRLAVPPRHATTEKAAQRSWPAPLLDTMPTAGLLSYPDGQSFLKSLAAAAPTVDINDVYFRMLEPHEIKGAMDFPTAYLADLDAAQDMAAGPFRPVQGFGNWQRLSQTFQGRSLTGGRG